MSEYLKPGLYTWCNGSSYWRVFENYHELSNTVDFKGKIHRYDGKQIDDGLFTLIQSFELSINSIKLPVKSRFEMILEKV